LTKSAANNGDNNIEQTEQKQDLQTVIASNKFPGTSA
jgi:hypothetical protein